jgi:hypothetical protein
VRIGVVGRIKQPGGPSCQSLNQFNSLDLLGLGLPLEASMLLLSAVTLAGSIVVVVLVSYCCSMFRDVRDAQDELRQQIQQFYHAALSAKGLEPDETIRGLHRRGRPFRRILEEIAD